MIPINSWQKTIMQGLNHITRRHLEEEGGHVQSAFELQSVQAIYVAHPAQDTHANTQEIYVSGLVLATQNGNKVV